MSSFSAVLFVTMTKGAVRCTQDIQRTAGLSVLEWPWNTHTTNAATSSVTVQLHRCMGFRATYSYSRPSKC